MSTADWPKWADMNWLRLNEGPSDRVELPIAPTMKYLTHEGERYFRMPQGRALLSEDAPEGRTQYGGTYLWAKWTPVPSKVSG